MDCYTCRSLSGDRRISPGPVILDSRYWVIEHAYPSQLKGWLVIVLKTHKTALHELTMDEFIELGKLTSMAVNALHRLLGCEKEYSACFAEKENFNHVHFHIVPVAADLPKEHRGSKVFALLNGEGSPDEEEEIRQLCIRLRDFLAKSPLP